MEKGNRDLFQLIATLWRKKVFLIVFTIIVALFGLIVGFISPSKYTSSISFIPESDEQSLPGGLSGIASLAGVNIGGGANASSIPPMTYPQLLNSTSFKKELLSTSLPTPDGTITYYEFLEGLPISTLDLIKKYTVGLPKLILSSVKSNSEESQEVGYGFDKVIFLSEKESSIYRSVQSSMSYDYNGQTRVAVLTFETDDPIYAPILTKQVHDLLERRIINIRNKNARNKLDFIQDQFDDKKLEYEILQDELADFKDSNFNLSSSKSQNELERLQSKLDIVRSVYQELAVQIEQAKIEVQENTPVFTVIQEPLVPIYRTSPKRFMLLIIWSFIGFILASFIVLIKEPLLLAKSLILSPKNR